MRISFSSGAVCTSRRGGSEYEPPSRDGIFTGRKVALFATAAHPGDGEKMLGSMAETLEKKGAKVLGNRVPGQGDHCQVPECAHGRYRRTPGNGPVKLPGNKHRGIVPES